MLKSKGGFDPRPCDLNLSIHRFLVERAVDKMKERGSQARRIMFRTRISTVMLSMAAVMASIYVAGRYVSCLGEEFSTKDDISG